MNCAGRHETSRSIGAAQDIDDLRRSPILHREPKAITLLPDQMEAHGLGQTGAQSARSLLP